MGIIKSIKKVFKKNEINKQSLDDVLLNALFNKEEITREKALTIPAVSSDVDFICGTIASMPIRLYRKEKGKTVEVENDTRINLLNQDTGDTLNAFRTKKAIIEDYLLGKGGYAYIEKHRNTFIGLHYVEEQKVTPYKNQDPIHKYVEFGIGTKRYKNYEILKLLRNTKDGATGKGLVEEISKALETAYTTLLYQLGLAKSGGNKRGFLRSEHKLSEDEMNKLKEAWKNLYQGDSEKVVILNNGLDFKESSATSSEMQLNENKKTLKSEIDSVFHINDTDFWLTFKKAIYPIIRDFETELNSIFLLESEKDFKFFKFDVKEFLKANLKERYEAYEKALKGGWRTVNEIRQDDDMDYIDGMDVLNVGLNAVLYDTKTQTYYTPNTNQITSTGDGKNTTKEGGDK